jgi:transposase
MPRGKPLTREQRERIGALVLGEGVRQSEAVRILAAGRDGAPPWQVNAETVRRTVNRLRGDHEHTATPSELAQRIVRILQRELAAIEQKRGAADLDRLDKLTATLRRAEPLCSPSKQGREDKRADLRSLMRQGERNGRALSDGLEESEAGAPAKL